MKRFVLSALVSSLAMSPIVVDAGSTRVAAPKAEREDAARETREALHAYRRALERELERLREQLGTLEDRARASLKDARPETQRLVERLREEHASARRKLAELGDELGGLWERTRDRMDRLVDDLRRQQDEADGRL